LKHIKGLDTLRAFAVIFVVMGHWGITNSLLIPAFVRQYIIPDGQMGVDIFFVLSGFLITSILLKAKIDNDKRGNLITIKSFMVRRALRIFPIYYLTVLFLLIIGYNGMRENAWYYLTYTSNILFFRQGAWGAIPHTWSLAVEEQFYLVWPWLILFVNKKYLKYVFILAIITGIVSSYITTVCMNKGGYPILVYNCLGCFGMGGFYAYARMDNERRRQFEKNFLAVFVICLITYLSWEYKRGYFWGQTTFLFRSVNGVIALQVIIAIINNKSEWIRKYVLENKVLTYIGKISYGIYLYHFLLNPFQGTTRVVLLFIICPLSYHFIEQPLLNLKKYFKYSG